MNKQDLIRKNCILYIINHFSSDPELLDMPESILSIEARNILTFLLTNLSPDSSALGSFDWDLIVTNFIAVYYSALGENS